MLRTDSISHMLLVFLFGNLDECFAYFLLIYVLDFLLNFHLQKQHLYLESTTQSPYWLKAASPLCILILCNVLDHLTPFYQIPGYHESLFRNFYITSYIVFYIKKVSPYLFDETSFFPKITTAIVNKLKIKIHEMLNKA